jgi:predicted RNA-binding protein YlqC (UPF0109 family)
MSQPAAASSAVPGVSGNKSNPEAQGRAAEAAKPAEENGAGREAYCVVRIAIPVLSRGKLIGHDGAVIHGIRLHCQVRIDVSDEVLDGELQVVTIYGLASRVAEALVEVAVETYGFWGKSRRLHARLLIDQSAAGALLGSRGTHVRALRLQFGDTCTIFIDPATQTVNSVRGSRYSYGVRPVHLTSVNAESLHKLCQFVAQLVADDQERRHARRQAPQPVPMRHHAAHSQPVSQHQSSSSQPHAVAALISDGGYHVPTVVAATVPVPVQSPLSGTAFLQNVAALQAAKQGQVSLVNEAGTADLNRVHAQYPTPPYHGSETTQYAVSQAVVGMNHLQTPPSFLGMNRGMNHVVTHVGELAPVGAHPMPPHPRMPGPWNRTDARLDGGSQFASDGLAVFSAPVVMGFTMPLPSGRVGCVIGKRGMCIAKIRLLCGVRIVVDDHSAAITGPRAGIQAAITMIQQVIDKSDAIEATNAAKTNAAPANPAPAPVVYDNVSAAALHSQTRQSAAAVSVTTT